MAFAFAALLLLSPVAAESSGARSPGPPPGLPADGPCAGTRPRAFRASDRLVMSYLYYWYDAHSLDNPSLTLQPPNDHPFDWWDPAWHRRQLADMEEAGVDVALPVYWGDRPAWSEYGLGALVAARESLLAEGANPPQLGLFFDSNLYSAVLTEYPELADLTDEAGVEAFAGLVAGFFDRIPACHWARIDGRPLVFLWRPDVEGGGVLRFDAGTLETLYRKLEGFFGIRPYIVRERTWDANADPDGPPLVTDDVFAWGAALNGPLFAGRTVAVGPGYDDRLIAERVGYVRDRDGGLGYARDLRTAALSGAPWLLLETWNELWEATAIGETAQYGRDYLHLTRRYVDLFRRLGDRPAREGWVDLGTGEGSYLTRLADAPEERGTAVVESGRLGARPLVEPSDGAGYFHFALQPRLRLTPQGLVTVEVEYLDRGRGLFELQYDSADEEAPDGGSLKATPPVLFHDTGQWRRHTFVLPDARFAKRQYVGYGDFRLRDAVTDGGPAHLFGRVVVSVDPGARPLPLAPESLAEIAAPAGSAVDLRWRGLPDAAGYLVELQPVDDRDDAATATTYGFGGDHPYGPLDTLNPGPDPSSDRRLNLGLGINPSVGVGPGLGASPGPELAHGLSMADRRRCAGGAASDAATGVTTRALTADERCLLAPAGPGLYRWRTSAFDASGAPLGTPSDWSLLLVNPQR